MALQEIYVGYIGGSIGTPRVGHIRVFAALTAVALVAIRVVAQGTDRTHAPSTHNPLE